MLLRHYSLYRIHQYWMITTQMDLSKKSILVYSGVKTASSTICGSLDALRLGMPIYHIHFLTEQRIAELEKMYQRSFSRIRRIPEAVPTSRYLHEQLEKGLDVQSWKIITGIREPIAQQISHFFYRLDVHDPPELDYRYKVETIPPDELAEELISLFLEDIEVNRYTNRTYYTSWFDLELRNVFGVDVQATDFPKSKGYKIYRGKHPDVLLYKVECLSKCAKRAFKEFLDIDNFVLRKENVAQFKKYAAVYQKFLDSIVLPESYASDLYSSRLVKHFYGKEELHALKLRWLGAKKDLQTNVNVST